MTRTSSLLFAASLIALPLSAFAQQNASPVAHPAQAVTATQTETKGPTATIKTTAIKTAAIKTTAAKTETLAAKAKTDVVTTHAKTTAAEPAKAAEPHKS